METCCPNCPAVWGYEEFQGQFCMSCGYPNHVEDDECPECVGDCTCDDIYDEEEDSEPNDLRNL